MEKSRPTKPENVPYIVFEGEIARQERHIKRLWIALIAAIVAIVLIVGGFIWYLNQYDYVSNESVTVDGQSGVANYIGKDGNIYNGKDNGQADAGAGEEDEIVQRYDAP